MWKNDFVPEHLAILEIILGIHSKYTKIFDLNNQLFKILWKEKENPVIAKNFLDDCGWCYTKELISRDISGFVLDGKLSEGAWIPTIHIIYPRLGKSAFYSRKSLAEKSNYSQQDINYVESLGRRLNLKPMGWGIG